MFSLISYLAQFFLLSHCSQSLVKERIKLQRAEKELNPIHFLQHFRRKSDLCLLLHETTAFVTRFFPFPEKFCFLLEK